MKDEISKWGQRYKVFTEFVLIYRVSVSVIAGE